jgi:hypothetical protein
MEYPGPKFSPAWNSATVRVADIDRYFSGIFIGIAHNCLTFPKNIRRKPAFPRRKQASRRIFRVRFASR